MSENKNGSAKDSTDADIATEDGKRPASADQPGVAPHGMTEPDGPGGTEGAASSDGDSGPKGES